MKSIELKRNTKDALQDGKDQLVDYLNRLSLNSGRLILFNRNELEDWDKVGEQKTITHQGKTITVITL